MESREGDSINDFKIAIQQAIDRDYPTISIYSEEIGQGFEKPCFFVKILSSSQVKLLDRRYKRTILFDVQYFSDKEELNSDCLEMADKLYKTLEYVESGGNKYRALKMSHNVTDNVLHFMLQFNYNILNVIESNKMKELEVKVSER